MSLQAGEPPDRWLRRSLALGVVAACTLVAVFAPSPDPFRRSAMRLHDFLHVPGLGIVATALLAGFPGAGRTSRARRISRLAAIFSIAVADGVAIEIGQWAMGGRADPWDVLRDAVGAGAVVLVARSLDRESGPAARWSLRGAAAAGVLAALVPTVAAMSDEASAARRFPVLADFERSADLGRFTWSQGSEGDFEPAARGGARGALRLSLSPGAYPGLRLLFFPRDWRGYADLLIDCTNLSTTSLAVTVRIDDLEHDEEYTDRFNRPIALAPGRNRVRIPLADVESAPSGRKLDLARVRSVGVFSAGLREPRALVFHEFRLEAKGPTPPASPSEGSGTRERRSA